MTRIKPIDSAWKDCPRADECCINDCPLCGNSFKSYDCDPSPGPCKLGKTVRLRLGKKWGLPNLGLKPREFSSYKNWHNQTDEQKKAKIEKLKSKSAILTLHNKGYAIIPKKKNITTAHDLEPQNSENSSCIKQELSKDGSSSSKIKNECDNYETKEE